MAKIYYYYGTMGSSKTAEALMTKYRYEQIGQRPCFCKTKLDNRDGERVVESRIGLRADNVLFLDEVLAFDEFKFLRYDVIIVDEVQFATKEQIDALSDICDDYNIPVLCYGLSTDFKTEMFEGAKRLFEIADKKVEVKQICWCGSKAIFNARVVDGKMMIEGEQIEMGGDERYVALCRKHYKSRQIRPLNTSVVCL